MKAVTWQSDPFDSTVRSRTKLERQLLPDQLWTVRPMPATALGAGVSALGAVAALCVEAIFSVQHGQILRRPHESVDEPALPTETELRSMAVTAPESLVLLLQRGVLPEGLLARGTEALGLAPSDIAVPVLIQSLWEQSPVVQEAAVYAMEHHIQSRAVKDQLETKLNAPETSLGVKAALVDALDED